MSARRAASVSGRDIAAVGDSLDSWKEIAAYLRRDVRTVMRWETLRGLPVHRLPGGARRSVFARKAELEAWLAETVEPEPANGPADPSIAVLPFVNLTPDADNQYFADGLADEILTLLASGGGLRVTARTSSFAFRGREADAREIGAVLGVSAILEGTLRKAGDRIRVSVQLISTRDGYHLWAEQYDRSADDVFAVQDDIAEAVVTKLRVRLRGRAGRFPHRRHLPLREAYHLYLRGRHYFTRRAPGQMQRAIECFERAVAIDPDYAAAHLGIADAFAALGLWGMLPPTEAFARAKEAASRALAIDDSLMAAHVVLGSAWLLADWSWERARDHFQQAVGHRAPPTGPFSIAFYYALADRMADAFQYFSEVFDRDPLSPTERVQAATVHISRREFDAATTLLEQAIDFDGELATARLWLGFCRGAQGRKDDALPLLQSAAERGIAVALPHLTCLLVQVGAADRARAVHEQLELTAAARYVSPTCLALSHAALGDEQRSRDFLARAEAERSADYTMYLLGPGFVALSPEWLQRWFEGRRRQSGLPCVSRA